MTDTMHPVQSLLALKPEPHFLHLIDELPDPNRLNDTDRPSFHCLFYFLNLSSRHQSLGSPQSQDTGLGSGPWVPCTDPHFPAPSGPAVAAEKALSAAPASPAFGGTPGTGLGPRSGVLGLPSFSPTGAKQEQLAVAPEASSRRVRGRRSNISLILSARDGPSQTPALAGPPSLKTLHPLSPQPPSRGHRHRGGRSQAIWPDGRLPGGVTPSLLPQPTQHREAAACCSATSRESSLLAARNGSTSDRTGACLCLPVR